MTEEVKPHEKKIEVAKLLRDSFVRFWIEGYLLSETAAIAAANPNMKELGLVNIDIKDNKIILYVLNPECILATFVWNYISDVIKEKTNCTLCVAIAGSSTKIDRDVYKASIGK